MLQYRTEALTDRTWFAREHARSLFTANWWQTQALLERELSYLDAEDVVFEVDVRPNQITQDGRIYANASVATPAVVVRFDSRLGSMVYRCDRYDAKPWGNKGGMHLWQHNVRAIAMTLEALRAAERYGAIDAGQQYTGFKALPAGRAMPASHMTLDEAWGIIGSYGERPISEQRAEHASGYRQPALAAFRKAKAKNHPDVRDGDHDLWHKVQEAAAVIGLDR